MINIGITGQEGFIGTHLYNNLKLLPNEFNCIDYDIDYFENEIKLTDFVSKCDIIVHLAAVNRHKDSEFIYDSNVKLVQKLIYAIDKSNNLPHIIFSSSSQEGRDNAYGKSKMQGRALLEKWSKETQGTFTGLVIPNVFGPFGRPNYNSVIATFSHQLSHGETPNIHIDSEMDLIYVGELVAEIIRKAKQKKNEPLYVVPCTSKFKVSEILDQLNNFKTTYMDKGEIPNIRNTFELNLFNTFRSYMDINNYFPIKLTKHNDSRGSFVELIRLGNGGQVSFSTTVPGITRGNHYHTRKIERFAVIKGKALIQLRRIGTNEVMNFYLDGNDPSYVDMPIWYTHNIKNIGDELLYTNFWINEPYNEVDADTFFEKV